MEQIKLYYAPPSFYSQIARLALAEAGIDHEEEIIIPGPPGFATYAPDYMKMNPGGTVPTLLVGSLVLDDSRKIMKWIAGPGSCGSLVPEEKAAQAEMERWIERAYRLSERELAYGTGIFKHIGRFANGKRLGALRRIRSENPDMAEVYDAKIADIEDFMRKAQDRDHVHALARKFEGEFEALDAHLGHSRHIAGETYSLADLCWTVTTARHKMLKKAPLSGRRNLARWFDAMKKRPSYKAAGVMDHFSFAVVVKMLAVAFSGSSAL